MVNVNIKNLFAPIGICQIVGLVLGIIVFALGIASRPYEHGVLRGSSDEKFQPFDFIIAHDAFFIGIILLLLFSIFSIVLTLLDSKEKIPGAGIHALIGVFCFVISIYLLYAVVTVNNNHCKLYEKDGKVIMKPTPKPETRKQTAEQKEYESFINKTLECDKKYPSKLDKHHLFGQKADSPHVKAYKDNCNCRSKIQFKFELCVAAGVFGFFYALLNIGTAVLVFLKRN